MNEAQMINDQSGSSPLAQPFTMKSLLRFAFPTTFMMLFSGMYTIADTMFVARFVNTNALSSINIVTPVINIIVGLGTMIATGGSAIAARITILLIFAPANILQVIFANLFVTAGKPGLGMGLGLAAGLINALLDFIFIVPMQMGIKGAAIATSMGYMIPAIATSMGYMIPAIAGVIFFLINKKENLNFVKPKLRLRVLGESCFNGSSEMVSQLAAAVTTFLFNTAMMCLLGEDGVAAITIIIYSQFLLTTLYIGFSMGVAPIFSYNYGSSNTEQLKRLFKICFKFIAGVSILVFALSELGGAYLVSIFTERNTSVYEITRNGYFIFPFSFLFCGLNIFTSALFTALSNGKISAVISFLRTFVFLTIGILVLPAVLGVNGVWLAVPLAEAFTLIFAVMFLNRYKKRYQYC